MLDSSDRFPVPVIRRFNESETVALADAMGSAVSAGDIAHAVEVAGHANAAALAAITYALWARLEAVPLMVAVALAPNVSRRTLGILSEHFDPVVRGAADRALALRADSASENPHSA